MNDGFRGRGSGVLRFEPETSSVTASDTGARQCKRRSRARAVRFGQDGLGYARAGRTEDATRLLREFQDRSNRGEYVPAFAPLTIHVGQGDVSVIRGMLSKALAEGTPPFTLRVTSGQFLEKLRSDPEIHGMLSDLDGE